MKTIDQVADIHSGYSFRGKVKHLPQGDLAVIQLKDLQEGYSAIGTQLTRLRSEGINDKYYLQEGDVLFISKGSNNRALVYNLDLPRATASSSFFIFRCDRTQVEPGYLAWFLNAPLTQHKLKQNLTGTYTLNLNRSVLEQLEIVLPSLEQQRKIASLDQLMQTEKRLSRELLRKRQLFVQTLLSNSLNPDQ